MAATLEVAAVSKSFGAVKALDQVDLTVTAGGFTALLGPSGCGKSTLLRCIAGFEAPDTGTIAIAGRKVFSAREGINVPPGERKLGMVFQSYALWPHMTVLDNVGFGLELAGVPAAERRKRVLAALDDVDLGGMEARYPSQLSGGQQQRVALARLLACHPPVFLMDEPLSNLDARLRMDMRREIRRMHEQCQAMTVYVTHDQGEAMALADTVVVMNQGRIEQAASPETVYLNPASVFVADFIGMPRINILPGTCSRDAGGRPSLRFAGIEVPAPVGLAQGDYRVAFRPEDVLLHSEPVAGAALLPITSEMPSGPEIMVHLASEQGELIARLPRRHDRFDGRQAYVTVNASTINVFDDDSGKLIAQAPEPAGADTLLVQQS